MDRTLAAARRAGFCVKGGTTGEVVVQVADNPDHIGEAEGILAAYGARESAAVSAALTRP